MGSNFIWDEYFTKLTTGKFLFYVVILFSVFVVTLVSVLEPFLSSFIPCEQQVSTITFENSLFVYKPCRYQRNPILLLLTQDECSFARRLLASVLLGGLIGWERREADRPAGIRTMSLVSLGSCLFTINSAFAFLSGPMAWDASRISAAIPSGVGFLGAGLIFKEAEKDEKGGITHVVHGLTTSASLWLSSAVGVACGGELYFSATFCVGIMLILLRFGPRANTVDEEEQQGQAEDAAGEHVSVHSERISPKRGYSTLSVPEGTADQEADDQSETSSFLHENRDLRKNRMASIRRRPNLGSAV